MYKAAEELRRIEKENHPAGDARPKKSFRLLFFGPSNLLTCMRTDSLFECVSIL